MKRDIKVNVLRSILMGLFIFSLMHTSAYAGSHFWNEWGLGDKGCGVIDEDAFGAYKCPYRTANYDRTITDIDFIKGTVDCSYGNVGSNEYPTVVVTDCAKYGVVYEPNIGPSPNFEPEENSVTLTEQTLADSLGKFGSRMHLNGISFNPSAVTDLLALDNDFYGDEGYFAKLEKKNTQIEVNKENGVSTELGTIAQSLTIDSHTNYKKTLAAAITATFTVDPDYFEDGFVNNLGEANYKNRSLGEVETKPIDVIDWLASCLPFYTETELKETTIMDFMDKQVLGFFINMVQTLREVYSEMIFLFFVIGGVYSFGFYSYKKSLEKYGKEPFNINKLSFLSSTAMAFLFFSAPVINDGEIINPYRDSNTTVESSAKLENWTSLGQETVRYVAQSSNYFANLSSDKLMTTYLDLVAKKSGFYKPSSQGIEDELKNFNDIQANKKQLTAKINFYENVCRKFFDLKDDEFFDKNKNASRMQSNITTDEFDALEDAGKIADRLNYTACADMEKEIIPDTRALVQKAFAQKHRIVQDLELLNTGSESIKRYGDFMKLMAWGQSEFGWIFSASIPVSYFFFDNAGVFVYDDVKKAGDPTIFKGEVNKKAQKLKENDDNYFSESIGDGIEWGVVSIGTSSLVQNTFFFLIPGFDKLFNYVDKTFQSFYMGSIGKAEKGDDTKEDTDRFLAGIRDTVSKIGKSTANTALGKMLSNTSAYRGKIGGYAFTILALFTSVVLFTYAISAVTIVLISAMLVLKITLYYIELMMFFLSVQVMGLYYVLMGQGQNKDYLSHYTKSLAGLFMTPILIVLITGAIIPAGKFFESFFSAIMLMLQAVIDNGGDFLGGIKNHSDATLADVSSSYLTGAGGRIDLFAHKMLIIVGIEGMTTVFSYFAILIISMILIMNYKSWFMKMVGMEGGIDTIKETGSELKQGAAGRSLNPVG